MSANPIDNNPTPKTTGSLEDLFRHHLGEEAAVPPRPMLWDQIDNSLLIRQNETYRRRLTATRWVAAASLLLATLAGTGWWAGHESVLSRPEMAANQPATPAANSSAADNTLPANATRRATGPAGLPNHTTAARATTATGNSTNGALRDSRLPAPAPAVVAANQAPRYTGFGPASARENATDQNSTSERGTTQPEAEAANGAKALAANTALGTTDAARSPLAAANAAVASNSPTASGNGRNLAAGTPAATAATTGAALATTSGAEAGLAVLAAPALPASTSATALAAPEQVGLLAGRSATLGLTGPEALPNGLATLSLPADAPLVGDTHRWHYGASYTASVFNPNVNFSRAGIEPEYGYNPALGADSPALTETAAAQYRDNLRPGLSQRIALLASRHLGGHWSLRTGVEFGQSTAKSSSSLAFVGEQIPDLGQPSTGMMHNTNFRYRTAGIPIEFSYTNPVKRGWSLYGRLGGVVNALLGVRSEVEGAPEATRTYSLTSAGMPYRRVLGNLRGAAGAQFRSGTGHWALALGPVAEIGLVSLNAHPVQSYLAQSRAYSFGIEASVEFGR
jgi:hypothetical protein